MRSWLQALSCSTLYPNNFQRVPNRIVSADPCRCPATATNLQSIYLPEQELLALAELRMHLLCEGTQLLSLSSIHIET